MGRIVIIGSSAAGLAAVDRIRELDPDVPLFLITAEKGQPYSRLRLPEYAAALIGGEELLNRPKDYYRQKGLEVISGRKVVAVHPGDQRVKLDNGEAIQYTRLLIASGSTPVDLPLSGTRLPGVFHLWSRQDAEAIRKYLPEVKNVAVIGAGLIGLKTAEALVRHGVNIYLVEREKQVLPSQLDEEAAQILQRRLEEAGIITYCGRRVTAIAGTKSVEGIIMEDEFLPCQMVLLTAGVRPNISFLEGTGIKINKGIVVDPHMATSVAGIWAAGDVVESFDLIRRVNEVNAVWYNAVRQGRVAAENMMGIASVYCGTIPMNSFHLFGLNGVALGDSTGRYTAAEKNYIMKAGDGYEKAVFSHEGQRMTGYLALGKIDKAGYAYYRILHDNRD